MVFNSRSSFVILSTFVTAGLLSSTALAITPGTVPGMARPENVERKYRIENERPAVTGKPVISNEDNGIKQFDSKLQFTLRSIAFEGNTRFSADELKSIYADKIGKKISLQELNKIVSEVTAFYRNQGFILSRAVLPPQKIDKGDVKIRIVEGFVSKVEIVGDVSSDSVIHSYADKIRASKPLNAKDLERYLLLMEDLPGVQARAVLRPSADTPGASDVIVNITRKNIEASLSFDNRGSRYLGPLEAGGTFSFNNLFGLDEQTQIRGLNTVDTVEELNYIELRHEEQLGSEGTKLVFSGNYVITRPGYTLEPLDLRGDTYTLSAGVTHPLLRSRQDNWFINSDFTIRRVNVEVADFNLYRDNLRVLTAGTAYDFLDSWSAINRMEANVSKGFNWDVGNDGLAHSRSNGETDFLKFTAKASRIQPISGPWGLSFAASGQYAPDALLAAEEFAIGGQEFGSAFDSAEITGDSGLAARLELQYSDAGDGKYLQAYQAYGFYDVGRVWNRNIVPGSEPHHISLASTGLGVRFNMFESLSGNVEAALPVIHTVAANGEDGAAPRLFFNTQYRF